MERILLDNPDLLCKKLKIENGLSSLVQWVRQNKEYYFAFREMEVKRKIPLHTHLLEILNYHEDLVNNFFNLNFKES